MKTPRTKPGLLEALKQQAGFLKSSCDLFDSGNEAEALRIAATLRVLLHDTASSTSLLTQLGYKDSAQYLDSSLPSDPRPAGKPGSFIMHGLPGLVGISFGRQGGLFIAPKVLRSGAKGLTSFTDWWKTPVIPSPDKRRFSRRELVLTMANQEGGAHVDEKIDEAYRDLTTSSLGMTFSVDGVETGFVNSAAHASMRAVAWEFLESPVVPAATDTSPSST